MNGVKIKKINEEFKMNKKQETANKYDYILLILAMDFGLGFNLISDERISDMNALFTMILLTGLLVRGRIL